MSMIGENDRLAGVARRDFLRWGGIAAGALAGSTLLAACGSGTKKSPAASVSPGTLSGSSSPAALGPVKYKWRTGTVVAATDPFYTYLMTMADAIKTNTDGAVEITVYPNGQLGAETDTFKLLQSGAIQFNAISTPTTNATIPSTILYSLPYVLDPSNPAKMHAIMNGATNQTQKADLAKVGVSVLGFISNGSRHLGGKSFFATPDAMSGVKIRIPGTPLSQSIFKSFGAVPTTVALTDTYSALQQGLVTAYEQPLPGILAEKWYEVANKITLIDYCITPVFVGVNTSIWSGLPTDVQAGIQKGIDSVGTTFDTVTLPAAQTAAKTSLMGVGATFSTPDLGPWRSATASVYEQYASQVGGMDLIKKVQSGQ